ncbi:MAG: hypothetical protein J4428_01660 [Candidatus Aenigmarchaeota archaeon]|nr:hypothetical protein [Candidatus Aenigmarchaeota archaeon]
MFEVRLSLDFNEEFQKFKIKAEKGDGEAKYLLRIIEKGIDKLKVNSEAGKHIPKKLIPKFYITKYEVTNLWKLNLDSFWRMIYTLEGDKINIYSIVLEVLDHKKYDKKFGYKTS